LTGAAAPRRVLVTADAVGGVWTHAVGLARGLEGRGVEVLLAVLGPAPDAARRADAAGLRVEATGLGLEWRDRAGPLARDARRALLALERRFRPDVVHANGFREAAAGFAAPVLVGAHSCVRTWWRACRGGDPPAGEWGPYERGVREGLAAAGLLVAPTAAFLAAFREAWGASTLPPARAVPNGLDPDDVPAAPKRPFVLAAGRLWDEAKGVATLAEAAAGLPWPVLVAGDMPTLRELWDGAARFVPPGDPGALRRALLDLIGDEGERTRLGALARERARTFTQERMVEGYLGAYAELLNERALTPTLSLCEGEGARGDARTAGFAPSPSARRREALPRGAGVRAAPGPPEAAA
jgi:glycosyltransferase involved in cell wall biosynthesis